MPKHRSGFKHILNLPPCFFSWASHGVLCCSCGLGIGSHRNFPKVQTCVRLLSTLPSQQPLMPSSMWWSLCFWSIFSRQWCLVFFHFFPYDFRAQIDDEGGLKASHLTEITSSVPMEAAPRYLPHDPEWPGHPELKPSPKWLQCLDAAGAWDEMP